MKDIMIDCHLAAIHALDPRKRPGYKLEIIGFDFLLDEDFRVWLIEVNTCPFMGPVLPQQHPNFMLDLLDDTFKLTIDELFHGEALPREKIEKETNYELLCTADSSVNKRSNLGLTKYVESEQQSPAKARNGGVDDEDGNVINQVENCEKTKQSQVCREFPPYLYPSKILYEGLVRSQNKHHDKWKSRKQAELV